MEATDKESKAPKILSLGRSINKLGLEMTWSAKGASLKLPNGDCIPLRIDNFCPHVSKKSLTDILNMIKVQDKAKKTVLEKKKNFADKLKNVGKKLRRMRLRLRTIAELNRHRRNGHKQYSKDCP